MIIKHNSGKVDEGLSSNAAASLNDGSNSNAAASLNDCSSSNGDANPNKVSSPNEDISRSYAGSYNYIAQTQHMVSINDNALIQKVSDEMVILDIKTGQYYTLNAVASDMLELMQAGQNCGQVAFSICNIYEVSEQEVQADISNMLGLLIQKQLVTIV